MWVRVLGSAAGGGFPQWNCNCPNCCGVRDGSLPCQPGTQSSIAVSSDYRHWFLFNASPDIRRQIETFPGLQPQGQVRHTPIQAIVLTDAELDHTIGLLSLRETRVLRIYATGWVRTALTTWNPFLRTLAAYCEVDWQAIRLEESMVLRNVDDFDSGLECRAIIAGSDKTVAFAPTAAPHPEATVGYRVTDKRTNHALVYMPGVQALTSEIRNQLRDCNCVFFDGTCWDDDELPRLGINDKTSRTMGHVPISGVNGSLEQLAVLQGPRRVYIHINNTNPILIENSPERQAVEARGIEVAVDGMEMEI